MATTYLLQCSCDKRVPVSPSQAGDRVRCDCGAELEVPTLRKMRELPQAGDSGGVSRQSGATAGNSRQSGGWGVSQGVLTAGLLLAAILGAAGGAFWKLEPDPPPEFDPQWRTKTMRESVDSWTPAQSFEVWRQVYRPITTSQLEELVNPYEAPTLEKIAIYRMYRWIFLGLAALVAASAVILFYSLRLTGM